mmetsp:Transcript_109870/g.317651  ORF Transcript_109870/g.317651 Transcript_109870/m.317651 type:complete len:129 (-) Transcript_109870:466-852(-)
MGTEVPTKLTVCVEERRSDQLEILLDRRLLIRAKDNLTLMEDDSVSPMPIHSVLPTLEAVICYFKQMRTVTRLVKPFDSSSLRRASHSASLCWRKSLQLLMPPAVKQHKSLLGGLDLRMCQCLLSSAL